ncbi:hypothetical protein DFP73DRAFT_601596 [Morchella snyderi]|nr:hypothetical protein DFP73DRAFT_601596 [Morchella snyderi]
MSQYTAPLLTEPNVHCTPRITTPADLDKPSEGRSGSAADTARATDTPISTSSHEPKLRDDPVDPASARSISINAELRDGTTNESSKNSTTPFIYTPDSPASEAIVSSSKTMIPPEPPTIPSNLKPQFQGEELLTTSVTGEATLMGATGGNYSAARTNGFAISGLIPTAATTKTNTGDTGVLGRPISPSAQSFSSPTDQKPLTLWEQALKKVPQESIIYPGGRAVPVGGLAQNLIDEVERKKLGCDSKRWFYNKNDNKVFIVETLLVQLNKYATIGDVMIQHNPDIVALVWGGFRGLLQVGTAYVDQIRSVSENVDYLVQLLCSCQIYERLYCQETLGISENLTKSLVDLYASILKFLCYTNQYLDHNTLVRIFKSFSQEMGRLLAEIKSHKATVEENISIAEIEVSSSSRFNQEQGFVAMRSLLAKIQEPLDDLYRVTELIYSTVENDRQRKILGWLSKVEYESHHILSQRRRQDGTGSWLFKNDAFVRWSGSEKNLILWLRADAGFGKTILACTIVDSFGYQSGSDDHVVAYFYCNYKEPDRRDAASILRTLVKQFCVKKGDHKVPTLIDELYEAREKRGHANGPLSPEENTELIINLSERYQSTTLIVDALDECDIGTRKSLFSSLHKIVQKATRVKIVVTSRYDDDINDSFSSGLCYCIDDKDNSADINLYVDAELDRRCDPKNAHDYELLLKRKVDPELKALIRSRLKERSNGMFMWVNLQINALCAARTAGGVLERIKSQDPNSHRVATIVLKWLLCAQEACTAGSVIQALAIDPGNAELSQDGLTWTIPGILGICKSLVVHDEALGIFRFAHFSVQEFLVVDPGFGRESSNEYVAEVCVTALLYHHGEGSAIPELYAYAMRYWGDHVRHSGATPGGLESLCMKFFKSSIAYNQWGSRVAKNIFPFLQPSAGENIPIVRPLFVASFYGLPDLSRLLLAGRENMLNSVNVVGQSPLILSSLRNHEQVAKLLLERGDIDVNLADKKGKTALYRAAFHGHDTIVHMLLEKGDVDVNAKCNKDKTPLLNAAEKGHDKVLQLLLEREDVDVNSKDSEWGRSPLSWAAKRGHDKVAQLLLEREDVDVNSEDRWGRTALHHAQMWGRVRVVELLEAKVANARSPPEAAPPAPGDELSSFDVVRGI